jgi:hypothetical protein
MNTQLEQDAIVGYHVGFADRSPTQSTRVRPIPDTFDLAEAGLRSAD